MKLAEALMERFTYYPNPFDSEMMCIIDNTIEDTSECRESFIISTFSEEWAIKVCDLLNKDLDNETSRGVTTP